MVASTLRPLSAFTRNIALGRASSTTPSNSSLSPLGSFLSRRSLNPASPLIAPTLLSPPFSSSAERPENFVGHFTRASRPVNPPEEAPLLVVGEEGCRHR